MVGAGLLVRYLPREGEFVERPLQLETKIIHIGPIPDTKESTQLKKYNNNNNNRLFVSKHRNTYNFIH